MITVEARVLGRKRPLLDQWSVDVPPLPDGRGEGGITLRELITRVVRAEVAAFRERQRARTLVHALTEREIEAGAARGKVDPGGRAAGGEVDEEAAVAAALAAFEDGLYLVILDGQELKDLDQPVYPKDGSRLVFLRLTFLAGA
jgi:predicted RNA-binding Zn ribbon-like protein